VLILPKEMRTSKLGLGTLGTYFTTVESNLTEFIGAILRLECGLSSIAGGSDFWNKLELQCNVK
jgi:hypothetical protein